MIGGPAAFLLGQLPYLPLHFAWLVALVVGLGLASTRSALAGGLLVAAAVLHGLSVAGRLAQQYALFYSNIPENTEFIAITSSLALAVLAVVQYSLLIAAAWAGRDA